MRGSSKRQLGANREPMGRTPPDDGGQRRISEFAASPYGIQPWTAADVGGIRPAVPLEKGVLLKPGDRLGGQRHRPAVAPAAALRVAQGRLMRPAVHVGPSLTPQQS